MNKLSKTGLTAVLLLFLAGNAPIAMAQQDGLVCPLEPQANRTLVLFGGTTPIVASDTLAEATAGPIAVSLPAGIYDITASSFDFHSTRQPPQSQLQEQFYLILSNGQTTNRISDLPDDTDSFTEQIDADFVVTSEATSITAQHTQYLDPGVPNSIYPVCIAFDDVTPTPSPTPTPTPVSGQGGPGDETDCCPGPDPDPEPEPKTSSVPRVAGIQKEASPKPSASPTPAVAGTLQEFPTAGFSLMYTIALIAILFTALMIWPSMESTIKTNSTARRSRKK